MFGARIRECAGCGGLNQPDGRALTLSRVKGGKEAEHEPSKHKSRAGPQLPVLKGGAVKRYLSFVSVFTFFSLFLVFSSLL